MEKIVEQGLLYDFYGELLTAHQRQIYESIVYENLSLSEIAEEQGITRQGVHDIVKRCDKALMGYEKKLKLIARFQKMKEKIQEIDDLTKCYEPQSPFYNASRISADKYRSFWQYTVLSPVSFRS